MMVKRFSAGLFFGIFFSFVLLGSTTAQQQSGKLNKSDSLLKLKVDKKKSLPITLKTKNVSVSAITKELSRHYKISFGLSRAISNYKPTLNLPPSTIESVLKKLAPFVVLEKEMTGGLDKSSITKAFLYAFNENMPVISDSNEKGEKRQMIVFVGNTEITEDSPDAKKMDILVRFREEKLTVRCQNQPALFVIGRIAEELRIPFMVDSTINPPITADFENLSLEKAFLQFPNSVKLKYLLDLNTSKIELKEISLEN